MKGNYQKQSPIIKFSPEAAGASLKAYETQHYRQLPNTRQDVQSNFTVVSTADNHKK